MRLVSIMQAGSIKWKNYLRIYVERVIFRNLAISEPLLQDVVGGFVLEA